MAVLHTGVRVDNFADKFHRDRMAFHRDSSAVSCGLLVVTLGAWNLVFWLLCWPELYANFFFEAGLCAPQGVPAIVPYRHCDSRCVGCGRCGYGQRRCVDVLAEHRRSDPHDLARSASLAGPCCGGYHCCRQSCRTRCRRRSLLALDDEAVDEVVDESSSTVPRDRRRHQRERGARRAAKLARTGGRGRSSCHTGLVRARRPQPDVRGRLYRVRRGGHRDPRRRRDARRRRRPRQPRPRLPRRPRRRAARARTPRAARAVGGVLLRPRARAAHRRARGERRRAALRRRDGVHVVAVAPPRRRLGAVRRRLLRRRRRRRRAPRSDGPQHRARDCRRRSQPRPRRRGGGAGDRVARCAAGAGRRCRRRACTRPSTRRAADCAGAAGSGRAVGPVAVAQPVGGGPVAAAQPVDGGGLSAAAAERYRSGRRRVPYGAEVRE